MVFFTIFIGSLFFAWVLGDDTDYISVLISFILAYIASIIFKNLDLKLSSNGKDNENSLHSKSLDNQHLLPFKSNIAAFEYSSMFMVNDYSNENPVFAIITNVFPDGMYSIKLANPDDFKISQKDTENPLTGKYNVQLAMAADRVPKLNKLDIIMCIIPKEYIRIGLSPLGASIISKLKPIHDEKNMIWLTDNN
jgi:hypothetical protein